MESTKPMFGSFIMLLGVLVWAMAARCLVKCAHATVSSSHGLLLKAIVNSGHVMDAFAENCEAFEWPTIEEDGPTVRTAPRNTPKTEVA